MKIWIDLSTAPDPLFFRPIISRLNNAGHKTWITVRDFCETVNIAEHCGFPYEVVGQHGGKTIRGKTLEIIKRSFQLRKSLNHEKIDVAVSFNSYAQGLAARLSNIPFVTIMDYEYQPANHFAFRLAKKILVPLGYDEKVLRSQGAEPSKVVFFNGLKEHVTLIDFKPTESFPSELIDLGISPENVLITMRPPALWSAYHRFENELFDEVVIFLSKQKNVKILLLPRYESQAAHFKELNLSNIVIPSKVLGGLNLIYWSDSVISAGGSMNREAVVLGTPSFTIFRGKMAGVDRNMIAKGIMKNITSLNDVKLIPPIKKNSNKFDISNSTTINEIISAILTV